MEVNDNEGCLSENGALTFIASKLAPTGFIALKLTQIDDD
ncbi:hypothetical protein AN403_2097 [Pseudomonas fluorescens]|uniref:Uncharacterized protein n=1 Tax=Pseudomonas fluorescens TaxID=294 RepID=A0A0P8WUG0_PSEFL|nr:hypothetical protein AN403_2097 [Pseudomonas fluorescens]